MGPVHRYAVVLLCSAGACLWTANANATDLLLLPEPMEDQDVALPAVSDVNGKWEFSAGALNPGGAGFRAAGSLSLPLGERFGAQADVMATLAGNGLFLGGAGHLFTRDPSQYLLGVTSGVVVAPGATLAALGLEGELYMDRWSIEAWGGLAAIDYKNPAMPDRVGLFGIGDLAYYPTDDLRVALGARHVLGDNALHLSAEYQLSDFAWPVSLTADARIYTTGNYVITAGLKGYLGPSSDSKSLIDRHRQDDPPNRALDLFASSVGILTATAAVVDKPDEEEPEEEPIDDPEYALCLENHEYTWPSDAEGWWNPDGDFGVWVYDPEADDCVFDGSPPN